jgi:hypothetical protein
VEAAVDPAWGAALEADMIDVGRRYGLLA